jgi:hypothetical protein
MNKFQATVIKVSDIAEGYCQGLGALGTNSCYVAVKEPRHLDGSVDIDTCTHDAYPHDNRWDYVFSYEGKAYYLEVHPATGGSVKEMEAKLSWLKSWLKKKAAPLDAYPSGTPRYTWVHSGKCGLLKSAPEYRRAATLGLIPIKMMRLG